MNRVISLTQGKTAIINGADYWIVSQFKWSALQDKKGSNLWYAVTNIPGITTRQRVVRMHRMITGEPPFKIDHKNRNGLDNRRCNLRPADNSQNLANSARRKDNSSGYKGVYWHTRDKQWEASLQFNGKRINLGNFPTAAKAHKAYKEAAKFHFKEYARTK